jgi:hypothetical protein
MAEAVHGGHWAGQMALRRRRKVGAPTAQETDEQRPVEVEQIARRHAVMGQLSICDSAAGEASLPSSPPRCKNAPAAAAFVARTLRRLCSFQAATRGRGASSCRIALKTAKAQK